MVKTSNLWYASELSVNQAENSLTIRACPATVMRGWLYLFTTMRTKLMKRAKNLRK